MYNFIGDSMKQSKNIYEEFISNFFKYLDKTNMTQKKYELENQLPASTLSKWKKGILSPSAEQIKQAADFFNITVNDLVYSDEEKKQIEVLADKSYDPIVAQQLVDFRIYNKALKKPFLIILQGLFSVIPLFIILSLVLTESSPFLYSIILIIPAIKVFIEKSVFVKKRFVINYTDVIYYYKKDIQNKSYFTQIVFKYLTLICSVFYFKILTILNRIDSDSSNIIVFLVLMLSIIFLTIYSFINIQKIDKHIISDKEISGYKVSLSLFFMHLTMTLFILFLNYHNLVNNIFFIFVSSLLTVFAMIDFVFVSINYSKYEATLKEAGKEQRKLFMNIDC